MAHSGKSITFATDLLPNEDNTYKLGSNTQRWKLCAEMMPLDTKTYTNVIATENNQNGAGFFYAKVRGTSYDIIWHTKFRITVSVPNNSSYYATSIYDLWGLTNTYVAYKCQNAIRSTSARPVYYNTHFRVNATGYNNGMGGWIGFSLLSSNEPTNTNLKRTVKVELLEHDDCTVELQDSLITPTNIPNRTTSGYYNSTNTGYDNFDFSNNGLRETGDDTGNDDDRTLQELRYFRYKTGAAGVGRYTLLMEESTGVYSSLTTTFASSSTPLTALTMNTGVKYKPGRIIHFNQNVNRAANTNIANDAQYFVSYSLIDLRFTFQFSAGALTAYQPIYMVGTLDNEGLFTIDPTATAWTQTLPTTETGKVYIFLGTVYPDTNTYRITLELHHPMYKTATQLVTPGDISGNAVTATTSTYLGNIGRLANMDVDLGLAKYNSKVFISYADGSTTTHKPSSNSIIFNVAWDNLDNAKYGSQIAIHNSATPHLQIRGCNNGTWDANWLTVLDSNNSGAGTNNNATLGWNTTYTIAKINGTDIKFKTMAKPTYTAADVGAATSGHNHDSTYLKLSGGTLTGEVTLSKANATSNLGIYVSHTNPNSDTTKAKKVALMIGGTSGSGGLYDVTKSKWIVYSDTSGNVILNGNASTASTASQATTTVNTSDTLYLVGVKSGATSTLLHDTSVTVKGGAISSTTLTLSGDTAATSNSTGALKVTGGIGAGANSYINDISLTKDSSTNSTISNVTSGKTLTLTSTSTLYMNSANGTSIVFKQNNAEIARFNINGNLALGVKSSAAAIGTQNTHKLYVAGDSCFNGKLAFGSQASNTITENASIQYNSTDQAIEFIFA